MSNLHNEANRVGDDKRGKRKEGVCVDGGMDLGREFEDPPG